MTSLELLAPARNAEIGIAAIDCGADAVYMAGPSFGARQDAGNPVEDIAAVCAHARRYGARVYVTINTILYDNELEDARKLMLALQAVGVTAFIVQDLAVVRMARESGITIPLHASTQCSVRTPEKARLYQDMGFSRIVLERQLSLEQIRSVRKDIDSEIEFFVHGALCVCYSGECYLSEHIAGRSANRGSCIQACRSRYDLVDKDGKVLLKDKALLSLKDYNLSSRLEDLADAGVCSFKIEGRLKNISYVRNVVRKYSMQLDALVAKRPGDYERASAGRVDKGFASDLEKTFNRGYTELFLDGKRGRWASMDIPKGKGEEVGTIVSARPSGRDNIEISVKLLPGTVLSNGDGFACMAGGEVIGFRGDVCTVNRILCRSLQGSKPGANVGLKPGTKLFRNISVAFEKEMSAQPCHREIPAEVSVAVSREQGTIVLTASARTQDGRTALVREECGNVVADNQQRMRSLIENQLSRRSGDFSFALVSIAGQGMPLLAAAALNGIRRSLAEQLEGSDCLCSPIMDRTLEDHTGRALEGQEIGYRCNVANALSRQAYLDMGASSVAAAYELEHQEGVELMRTKYCIRYELGMCLKHGGNKVQGPLYLLNNGRRLALGFDCANCEMTVKEA